MKYRDKEIKKNHSNKGKPCDKEIKETQRLRNKRTRRDEEMGDKTGIKRYRIWVIHGSVYLLEISSGRALPWGATETPGRRLHEKTSQAFNPTTTRVHHHITLFLGVHPTLRVSPVREKNFYSPLDLWQKFSLKNKNRGGGRVFSFPCQPGA